MKKIFLVVFLSLGLYAIEYTPVRAATTELGDVPITRENYAFVFNSIPPKKYKYGNKTYTLISYQKEKNGVYIGYYYL